MNSTLLLPTVFSSKMSPKSIPLDLDLKSNTIENILNSIAIYTPSRANAELDLFSIIISDKSTEENQDLQSYYGYSFDQRKNEFNEFMYSMYNTYHGMPDWVSSSGLITNEDMIWTHQIVYDLDYDAYYDKTVLKFDGEGLGNFNNWLQDSALFDFENDGVWDAQEKWDTVVSTYQVSDPATYGNGYYFLSQTKTYIHEFWEDLTGDGIFNLMTRNYSYTSLKKGVPNYREFYMDGAWNRVNYFQNDITPDSWTSLTRGILRQYDLDEDGVFEYVEQREDRFQNDQNLDPFEDEDLIFETFTKWTTDETGSIQVEQGNTLVTDLTFILIGPDPIDGWNSGNGFYENNITGQFVVVRNVPVTFDPRPDVSSWKRTANNGVIAWYDSNSDGYYEIAFIFTYQSFQEKIAIAVYLSKSGRQEVYTDPKQFKESGDTVIASHWLSGKYGYSDMWDVGWDLALEDHNQLLASNDFWVQTIMDTVGIALIMFAVALAPFSFGASLVITTALFLAFQYLVRPMMMDIFTDLGWLKRDRSHVLGGTDESGCKETLWDYVMEAGDNLLTDFSAWGVKPIPSYVEQAFFTDVEPFYQDLHQWQFLPETPVEQRHPDQDVYVEFEVPTLWAPTADNEIAALDLFQALSNGAVFATQYAELQYLGIEKGIPTYGDILAKQSRHRRVMHEFFFRDGPWGTEHLWLTNDATKDFKTLNKIQEPLNQLAQLSQAKFTFLEYTTNSLGQPQLTATLKSFMNYSDPVVYEIDYMQMCMITKYRSAYEAGQKYNPTIFYTMLAIQAVQTAIGIMAGYAGAALQATSAGAMSFGTALKSVMTQSGTKSAFWSFIKEMFEEMVWENLVSEAAQFFGASEAFAEQLGELIGMDGVMTSIKHPGSIITSIRTMVKNMQAMHQYVFSSQSHTTTKSSERVSVFTRMRALYVSYRAASLVDAAMMTKMQESMTNAAANAKSGGQLNVVEKLDIISSILGTKAKHYDNHQRPMAQLRQLIRQQLLTKFIEQGANVAEDIRAVLKDPTLRALKGLGQGKDGVTRFEFIELQRKGEKVDIYEDGSVVINDDKKNPMQLEEYLLKAGIKSFSQLFTKFDSFTMIDPKVKSKVTTKTVAPKPTTRIVQKGTTEYNQIEQRFKETIPPDTLNVRLSDGKSGEQKYVFGKIDIQFNGQNERFKNQVQPRRMNNLKTYLRGFGTQYSSVLTDLDFLWVNGDEGLAPSALRGKNFGRSTSTNARSQAFHMESIVASRFTLKLMNAQGVSNPNQVDGTGYELTMLLTRSPCQNPIDTNCFEGIPYMFPKGTIVYAVFPLKDGSGFTILKYVCVGP